MMKAVLLIIVIGVAPVLTANKNEASPKATELVINAMEKRMKTRTRD
jgi:hypothetical protein